MVINSRPEYSNCDKLWERTYESERLNTCAPVRSTGFAHPIRQGGYDANRFYPLYGPPPLTPRSQIGFSNAPVPRLDFQSTRESRVYDALCNRAAIQSCNNTHGTTSTHPSQRHVNEKAAPQKSAIGDEYAAHDTLSDARPVGLTEPHQPNQPQASSQDPSNAGNAAVDEISRMYQHMKKLETKIAQNKKELQLREEEISALNHVLREKEKTIEAITNQIALERDASEVRIRLIQIRADQLATEFENLLGSNVQKKKKGEEEDVQLVEQVDRLTRALQDSDTQQELFRSRTQRMMLQRHRLIDIIDAYHTRSILIMAWIRWQAYDHGCARRFPMKGTFAGPTPTVYPTTVTVRLRDRPSGPSNNMSPRSNESKLFKNASSFTLLSSPSRFSLLESNNGGRVLSTRKPKEENSEQSSHGILQEQLRRAQEKVDFLERELVNVNTDRDSIYALYRSLQASFSALQEEQRMSSRETDSKNALGYTMASLSSRSGAYLLPKPPRSFASSHYDDAAHTARERREQADPAHSFHTSKVSPARSHESNLPSEIIDALRTLSRDLEVTTGFGSKQAASNFNTSKISPASRMMRGNLDVLCTALPRCGSKGACQLLFSQLFTFSSCFLDLSRMLCQTLLLRLVDNGATPTKQRTLLLESDELFDAFQGQLHCLRGGEWSDTNKVEPDSAVSETQSLADSESASFVYRTRSELHNMVRQGQEEEACPGFGSNGHDEVSKKIAAPAEDLAGSSYERMPSPRLSGSLLYSLVESLGTYVKLCHEAQHFAAKTAESLTPLLDRVLNDFMQRVAIRIARPWDNITPATGEGTAAPNGKEYFRVLDTLAAEVFTVTERYVEQRDRQFRTMRDLLLMSWNGIQEHLRGLIHRSQRNLKQGDSNDNEENKSIEWLASVFLTPCNKGDSFRGEPVDPSVVYAQEVHRQYATLCRGLANTQLLHSILVPPNNENGTNTGMGTVVSTHMEQRERERERCRFDQFTKKKEF